MIVSKNALRSTAVAASKNASRFNLNGLYLEPEKNRVTATDGNMLVTVKEEPPKMEEFPDGHAFSEHPLDADTLIHRDSAERIVKAMPKARETMPILGSYAALGSTTENPTIRTRVGEIGEAAEFPVGVINEEFPNYRQCIPTRKSKVTVTLDAKLLKRVCESVLRYSPDTELCTVTLSIWDENSAVRFDRSDPNRGEWTAVAMPCRSNGNKPNPID